LYRLQTRIARRRYTEASRPCHNRRELHDTDSNSGRHKPTHCPLISAQESASKQRGRTRTENSSTLERQRRCT
jgi:hypothetical protein